MLSFAEAERVLSYDPLSGLLTWKVRIKTSTAIGSIAGGLSFSPKNAGRLEYIIVTIHRTRYAAHRLCWLLYYGEWPMGEIDHQNHIGTDNRIENLRDVSGLINSQNKRLYRNNTSGCPGVYWLKKRRRWMVVTCVLGKRTYIGRFKNLEDAILARKQCEAELGFHPNHGDV